ncbi:hypothetical protein KC19_3G166100 [Ceratodon purpureus]|uniref:Uncharacterized protein n=1 Tax=Ceratodon purpureus TaxID=3225 RepID=A0A8T0ILD8_CERPU|nr:hypothetical protein KC19_3G166100 [Ceratodon purpureus]
MLYTKSAPATTLTPQSKTQMQTYVTIKTKSSQLPRYYPSYPPHHIRASANISNLHTISPSPYRTKSKQKNKK